MQSSLTSLIVAVLREILWNTINEFPRFSATQLTVKKSLISSYSQRLIEIVFVVQPQTLHEISLRQELLENLTVELDTAIIK